MNQTRRLAPLGQDKEEEEEEIERADLASKVATRSLRRILVIITKEQNILAILTGP